MLSVISIILELGWVGAIISSILEFRELIFKSQLQKILAVLLVPLLILFSARPFFDGLPNPVTVVIAILMINILRLVRGQNKLIFSLLLTGFIGFFFNFLVMGLNGGRMPVITNDPTLLEIIRNSNVYMTGEDAVMPYLGDWVELKISEIIYVMSPGDALIAMSGWILFIYNTLKFIGKCR